jgi:hypothetical protein
LTEKAGFHGAVNWTHNRRANQLTGTVDIKDVEKAQAQISAIRNQKNGMGIEWEHMGPTNIGGRTRAIVIDKDNPNVMYVGGVAGGLWKSTTGGLSWTQIRYQVDNESGIPNLAIASMCQAPNGDIYFGTGEGHYRGFGTGKRGMEGAGIWKSTDGETFTRLASTWADAESKDVFSFVNKMAADPTNANRIFAATVRGLRLSEDGGQTWINPVSTTSGVPVTFSAGDVKVSSDGTIVITSLNGQGYVSHSSGADGTFTKISGSGENQLATGARLEFGIAPSDKNYIYCQASKSDGSLLNIYRSTDGGNNWTIIGPGGSDEFNPLGDQGTYDNVIAVFPDNKNEIVVGGQLSVWKWSEADGWSLRTISGPITSPYYVHADQHEIVFHPENPSIVFVGSDGGIHRSLDRGLTWQTLNKYLNITQFYGIGFSPTNELIGGTQDNGTLYMDPDQIVSGGTSHHYVEVSSGDGGYAEISQLNPNIVFSTVYYGTLYRSEERGAENTISMPYNNRLFSAVAPGDPASGNNFVTPIALWESFYDINSTDTIVFPIGFNVPADTSFLIESDNVEGQYMNFTPETAMSEGDTIRIIDHYQAALAVGFNGSVWATRDPLNFKIIPNWVPVADTIGNVETLTWSEDGNHLFFANQGGELYRISNFNNAYTDSLMDCERESYVLTTTRIARFSGRIITGIAVDPNNADNVLITLGNYGNTDFVYYSSEATTATETSSAGTFESKQGDLPEMPAYSAVIVWNDYKKVLVGTEYGIWGTTDITAANPSWTDENNGADYAQVYMIRQQTKSNGWVEESNRDSGVRNHGYIWAGTHGRGIFRTSMFEGPVGIEPEHEVLSGNQLVLYPNPSNEMTNLSFNMNKGGDASIYIFDMQGRIVKHERLNDLYPGAHNHTINVSSFSKGMYIVKLNVNNESFISRIIVE